MVLHRSGSDRTIPVPILAIIGTADAVLDLAAGRIEEEALPGTPGHVGTAAHRDGFFRVLKDIKEGDALVLDTPSSTEQYRVEWIAGNR